MPRRPPSPTMRRRLLGERLRALREAAKVRVETAAAELDCSIAKIRHIESGRNAPGKAELTALVGLYGADAETHAALEEIRSEAARPGWWATARLPSHMQNFVGAEADAVRMRTFGLELPSGLLQIDEFVRSLNELSGVSSAEIDRAIDIRQRRRERLTADDDPLILEAVLSEGTLRRLASAPYAKAQVRHLLTMAERENITVQVLPFSKGLHVSMTSGFVLLDFDPEISAPVAYLEYAAGGDFVDDQKIVTRMIEKFTTLQEMAMSPEESAHFIREWI